MKRTDNSCKIVLAVSLLVYVLCYFYLFYYSGKGMSISWIIPVVAFSWYFGFKWGICVGLLSLPVNVMMASFVGLDWWNDLVINGALIQGTAGCALIGSIVGYMSGLSQHLEEHRDHLNQLVQERTADLTRSNEQLKIREKEWDADNRQIKASEQQLRSAMEQLEASNQQLIASEREILESKKFLENVFETNMDGIIVGDEWGCFVKVNHAVEEITGYSEAELIGKHPRDLVEEDKQGEMPAEIRESLEKGEIKNLEILWRRKDGSICPLEFNVKFLKDDSGNITGSIGSIRDITQRKETEAALKESEERLELSYKATKDGLWDWNIQTGKCFFNPRFYTMLGYEPYEMPHSFKTWESLVHPDDIEPALQIIRDHVEKRSDNYEQEFRMQTKSGDFIWVLVRGRVIAWDEKGEPSRMIGIHTDITQRQQFVT